MTGKLRIDWEAVEDMRHMKGAVGLDQEIIEAEILSMVNGKKITNIESLGRTVNEFTFAPQLGIEVEWDEDVDETVEENIEEIRRQFVMNSL